MACAALTATATFGTWAAADVPSSLSWNAPPSCPGRDAVLERLRQAGNPEASPSPLDARVTITQDDDNQWRGHVQLVTDHVWTDRSVGAAATCEAVVEAIVVVIGVAATAHPDVARVAPWPPVLAPEPPAPPPPEPPFGKRGQLAITADAEASLAVSLPPYDAHVLVAPGVDLFVAPHFSVGAMLVYEHRQSLGPDLTPSYPGQAPANNAAITGIEGTFAQYVDTESLGGGVRLGYDFALSDLWSFWPTVSAAYENTWVDDRPEHYGTLSVDGFFPLVFHPAGRFVAGVGPDVEFLHERNNTSAVGSEFGLRLRIGGWAIPGTT